MKPRHLHRNAVIHLTRRQWEGKREIDSYQLTTQGELSYEANENVWSVSYRESDDFGMNDTLTRVSLFPDGRLRVRSEGSVRQEINLVKGEQIIEQRETPFGRMKVSFFMHEIDGTLNEKGGDLRLGYAMSLNDRHTYSTDVNLQITPEI